LKCRDRDTELAVSRRDQDVQKNASRLSRDQDARDQDYNPGSRHYTVNERKSVTVVGCNVRA